MTASIRGMIRTGAGKGIAGASVVVVEAPGPVPDISPMSNEQGKFALDNLPPGDYRLRAFGPANERGEAKITVVEDKVANVDIVISPT